MAKVFDLSASDGDLVIIGNSLVLPNSTQDSSPTPLNGALRFNPQASVAELFVNGTWIPLSGTGGGSYSPSTISMAQVVGLVAGLANKADRIHNHVISDITGLTTALSGKIDVGHTFGLTDITGLQTALDAKSYTGHMHNITEIEKITACFPGNPPALFKLTWVASGPVSFPANLSGSQFSVLTPPAASYVISMYKNVSTSIGTITISSTGVALISVAAFNVVAGDTISFVLPTRDTTIDTITMSIVGSGALENTSPDIAGAVVNGNTTQFAFNEVPGGTVNGTNTVFATVHNAVGGSLMLFYNGQLLDPLTDYTYSAPYITMTTAPTLPKLKAHYAY